MGGESQQDEEDDRPGDGDQADEPPPCASIGVMKSSNREREARNEGCQAIEVGDGRSEG